LVIFDLRYLKGGLMATITKQTSTEKGFGSAILSDQVKTHANDPFVVKKVAKALETLKKVGLPNTTKK
jgi:hypothetical protein